MNPNLNQTPIENLGEGVNIFRWVVSSDLCETNYVDIRIDKITAPEQPSIENPVANILRSSVAGDTYEWYLDGVLMEENSREIEVLNSGNYEVIQLVNSRTTHFYKEYYLVLPKDS